MYEYLLHVTNIDVTTDVGHGENTTPSASLDNMRLKGICPALLYMLADKTNCEDMCSFLHQDFYIETLE